ncbi:MAG: two pore domain potassium channel family protein, partial [Cyanobacteria bacterium J06641_5]
MKPIFNLGAPSQHKYSQLLIVLVLNLALSPFLSGNVGGLFTSAIQAYTIVLIVRTFSLKRRFFRIYAGFILLVFSLEIPLRFGWFRFDESIPFFLLIQAVYAIYLSVAAGLVLRDVWFRQHVKADTIRGG